MLAHRTTNCNKVVPSKGIGVLNEITHPYRALNSRMGYLYLNDSIATTNAAKATANINDSNTDIGTPLFAEGYRSPLSHLFCYSSITLHIRSRFTAIR